jgi:hypothetical protein
MSILSTDAKGRAAIRLKKRISAAIKEARTSGMVDAGKSLKIIKDQVDQTISYMETIYRTRD